jgi:hypothetical protein
MVDFTSSSFRDDGDCASCGAAGLRGDKGAEMRGELGCFGVIPRLDDHVARDLMHAVSAGELRITPLHPPYKEVIFSQGKFKVVDLNHTLHRR